MKKILFLLIMPVLCFSQNTKTTTYKVKTTDNYGNSSTSTVTKTEPNSVQKSEMKHIIVNRAEFERAAAEREKVRFEKMVYKNQLEKEKMLEIAKYPVKAFESSQVVIYKYTEKMNEKRGFNMVYYEKWTEESQKEMLYKTPEFTTIEPTNLFFEYSNGGYQNKSLDGKINYEYRISLPKLNKKKRNPYDYNCEDFNSPEPLYCDVDKRRIYGKDGIKLTLYEADEYEKTISIWYMSVNDDYLGMREYNFEENISNFAFVRISGDKEDVTFEELEGRKAYFEPLVEKYISNASFKIKDWHIFNPSEHPGKRGQILTKQHYKTEKLKERMGSIKPAK